MPPAAPRPDDLNAKLDFLERRVTLLERDLARLGMSVARDAGEPAVGPIVRRFGCDTPDLLIVNAHSVESDEFGAAFRWIGGQGPLQFLAPFSPPAPGRWRFHVRPHARATLDKLTLTLDDRRVDFLMTRNGGDQIVIDVATKGGHGGSTSFVFEGVASVRPSEIEASDDRRLLALRFYALEFQSSEVGATASA